MGSHVPPASAASKEPGTVVMPETVRAVIARHWLARTVMTPTGPMVTDLVLHRDGRPIVDFRKQWAKACIAAGLRVTAADGTKRATALFHDFRRSCVRNLENASTPRKVAKSITGHITDSVYERYHVVKDEDQRAALARVEAAFPPKSRPAAPATALDVA